ncbi:hypothetical protein [Microbacterium sp. RURRCA19A]|uniref:hypothetical protein n=1 Tax=Microbacterium sp. RURRCA19A TaxID=1907391 RepID=UPI000956C7C5|nr:hypothetical protein [Microbacterium sp. RURRCA19A]SIS17829.1 hypothetical protein SAMN05880568_3297 [Microbacterium sp. RURRCA19A]
MTPYLQPSGILSGGLIPVRDFPSEQEPWIELGWPGLESKRPCLVMLNFDSSGSVIAPQGNDPIGNRFNEARRAIRLVADWTYTSRSKVAVLHFDHPLGASGVVSLNDRRLLQRLDPSLQNPGGRGISDLLPSLSEMERLAEAHPEHDLIGVIVSDFELSDVDLSEVFTRLRAFPGRIHAVVLGGQVPPDLVGADNVTVTTLSAGDPPGAFAAALHRSLTATRVAARHSLLHGPAGKQVLS